MQRIGRKECSLLHFNFSSHSLHFSFHKRFFNRSCGLVGYPNVGKSSLFNVLTQSNMAQAENFPFCTIEPNISKVLVPDPTLEELAKIQKSEKILHGQLEIHDIAGLIKGASKGDGLGNKFLSNIRNVSCILQVVRVFEDVKISKVENCSPLEEYQNVETELLLSDLEVFDRMFADFIRKGKSANNRHQLSESLMQKIKTQLENGANVRDIPMTKEEKRDVLRTPLLSAKPILVLLNVSLDTWLATGGEEERKGEEKAVSPGEERYREITQFLMQRNIPFVKICVQIENEIQQILTEEAGDEFAKELMETYQISQSPLKKILTQCKNLLDIKNFYTIGVKEARSWYFSPEGEKLPECGGLIHSDFENHFAGAYCIPTKDFLNEYTKNEKLYKTSNCLIEQFQKAGKLKIKQRDYVVQDKDILLFQNPKK